MRADTSQLKQRGNQRMVDLSSFLLSSKGVDKHQQSVWAQGTWKIHLKHYSLVKASETVMQLMEDFFCDMTLVLCLVIHTYCEFWEQFLGVASTGLWGPDWGSWTGSGPVSIATHTSPHCCYASRKKLVKDNDGNHNVNCCNTGITGTHLIKCKACM